MNVGKDRRNKNYYCIASDHYRYLIGIGWQGTVEEESTAADNFLSFIVQLVCIEFFYFAKTTGRRCTSAVCKLGCRVQTNRGFYRASAHPSILVAEYLSAHGRSIGTLQYILLH